MVELISIGQTIKPHGIDGFIRIRIEDKYLEDLTNARAVFLNLDGSNVPYLIENVQANNHILLKLQEVDDPQTASPFSARDLFLESKEVSEENLVEETAIDDFIGFKVYNQNKSYVGTVSEVIENTHQALLEISGVEKKFIMPFHEDLILEVDEMGGIIHLLITDGLEDL